MYGQIVEWPCRLRIDGSVTISRQALTMRAKHMPGKPRNRRLEALLTKRNSLVRETASVHRKSEASHVEWTPNRVLPRIFDNRV